MTARWDIGLDRMPSLNVWVARKGNTDGWWTLAIASPGLGPRVDIVAELNGSPVIVAGTTGPGPVPELPPLPVGAEPIAYVSVPVGTIGITRGLITMVGED